MTSWDRPAKLKTLTSGHLQEKFILSTQTYHLLVSAMVSILFVSVHLQAGGPGALLVLLLPERGLPPSACLAVASSFVQAFPSTPTMPSPVTLQPCEPGREAEQGGLYSGLCRQSSWVWAPAPLVLACQVPSPPWACLPRAGGRRAPSLGARAPNRVVLGRSQVCESGEGAAADHPQF